MKFSDSRFLMKNTFLKNTFFAFFFCSAISSEGLSDHFEAISSPTSSRKKRTLLKTVLNLHVLSLKKPFFLDTEQQDL